MNALLAVVLLTLPQDVPRMEYEEQFDQVTLEGQLDWAAVLRTWRVKGVLVCTRGTDVETCLIVENAFPCGLFEVIRQPFRTHLKEGAAYMGLLKDLDLDLQSRHGEAMQFADVRAWSWVPDVGIDTDIPIAIPDGTLLELKYISELDHTAWRSEWMDLILSPQTLLRSCEKAPNPKGCAGRWGSYDPRIGFMTQSNEVLASYLQGLRGGRVAHDSMGRITLGSYDYEPRTGHYIQMISPSQRLAVQIGTRDISGIEREALSKRGAYLFAHFGIFEECDGCLPIRLVRERMPQ